MQSEQLLSMLGERLALSQAQMEQCSSLYNKCWAVLISDNKVPASLLQGDMSEDVWRACLLWLIKSLVCKAAPDSQQPLPGLPLGEMLNACKVNLVTFFKELPVVVNKLKPVVSEAMGGSEKSIETALQLREWQETLVSLQHISNKYKDLFWHMARSTGSSSSAKQPLMRAGWLAFLMIKAQLLPGFPDLVSCLELLVCVLNLLLASSAFTDNQLQALQSGIPSAIDPTGKFNTLKALSLEAKVDYVKTKVLMPQIEAHLRALLESGQFSWLPSPLPEGMIHPQAQKVDTCCGLYLECLGSGSKPDQMIELVLHLDQEYNRFYMTQGEIDERDFLLNDFGGLASPRAAAAAPPAAAAPAAMPAAAAAAHLHSSKPPLAPHAAHTRGGRSGITNVWLESPLPIMQLGNPGPATPITQTMGSVAWLRGLVKDLDLTPNPKILRYMAAAGSDAERALMERVQAAAEAVFLPGKAAAAAAAGGGSSSSALRGVPELQQHLAKERSEEGLKLYWHVLEAMLTAEEQRAGLAAAAQLLLRWSFHQCLLACCFELVAATYRMGVLSFPAIPAKLGLKPFDLSKMIGPFVRAEPTLPRELKRHMFTVEEKILESLGWAPGSSFYKLARAAVRQQQQQNGGSDDSAATAGKGDTESRGSPAAAAGSEQQQQEGEAAAAEGEQLQHVEVEQHLLQQIKDTAAADPAAAAAAVSRKRSNTGSPEPMDTNSSGTAAAAAAAGSSDTAAQKRQRSDPAAAADADRPQAAAAAAVVSDHDLPLPSAIGAPGAAAAAAGDASARAVLHDYCRKVLKLAAFRMVAISEGLDFSPMDKEEVIAAAHDVLSHALYNHTQLFYGRHLDTLLLASLYGYCKVNRLQQITFREIIAHYKRQAHAKQEVFRTVVLKQTDPGLVTQTTGDIIGFYNAVYVPVMKGYLLTTVQQQQAAAAAGQTNSGSSTGAAAARSGRQHSGDLSISVNDSGAQRTGSEVPNSPITTALMLAAQQQQQQQQQRGWAAAAGGSPASLIVPGSSTYRALSLAGGGSSSSSGAGLQPNGAGLNLGSQIGGGLSGLNLNGFNPMNPNPTSFGFGGQQGLGFSHVPGYSQQVGLGFSNQGFAGSGYNIDPGYNSYNSGFNSSLSMHGPGAGVLGGLGMGGLGASGYYNGWNDDGGAAVAAAAAAAVPQPMGRSSGAKASVMTGVSNGGATAARPSRLSRMGSEGAAAAAAPQQQQQRGGYLGVPKSIAAAADQLHRQQMLAAAAVSPDDMQQQDQDQRAAAGSSDDQHATSDTAGAAVDATAMDCDDSHAADGGSDHSGSSGTSSRSRSGSGSGSPYSSPRFDQAGVTSGDDVINVGNDSSRQLQQPDLDHATSAGHQSAAGLTTLMRALDTSSSSGGSSRPAAAAAEVLAQKLGKQQQQHTTVVVQDT